MVDDGWPEARVLDDHRRRPRSGTAAQRCCEAGRATAAPAHPTAGGRDSGSFRSSMAGTRTLTAAISFSFGYSNMNSRLVEIPLGPDNFIMPKEYDGRQPTSFPIVAPEPGRRRWRWWRRCHERAARRECRCGAGARCGRQSRPRPADRDRGVFTMTVPAGYKGDVVWTLRYAGQTTRCRRGRSRRVPTQLAGGDGVDAAVPPLPRTAGRRAGPGILGRPASQVGTPVELTMWLTDDAVHEKEPIKFGKPGPA